MKRIAVLLLLGGGMNGLLWAQSISPEVLAAGGGEGVAGSTTIQWTVGEAAIETLTSQTQQVSQGFHQPQYLLVALEEPPFAGLSLTVFPNPTQERVFLSFEQDREESLRVDLIGLDGQLLDQANTSELRGRLEFDLSSLSDGQYFLRVNTLSGQYKAYKIQKIH